MIVGQIQIVSCIALEFKIKYTVAKIHFLSIQRIIHLIKTSDL